MRMSLNCGSPNPVESRISFDTPASAEPAERGGRQQPWVACLQGRIYRHLDDTRGGKPGCHAAQYVQELAGKRLGKAQAVIRKRR